MTTFSLSICDAVFAWLKVHDGVHSWSKETECLMDSDGTQRNKLVRVYNGHSYSFSTGIPSESMGSKSCIRQYLDVSPAAKHATKIPISICD